MWRTAWSCALLLPLVGCAGGARLHPETGAESPPNVVMIISDDHAWGDYGFMGHPDVQTPHIDALAAESMVYTRGYNPTPLCRPSLATMATGLYAHEHGITGNDPPGGAPTMRDPAARARMVELFGRRETLPELLGGRGYVSLQTGKWWEGDPKEHGFTAAMTHGDVTRGGRHGDEGLKIGREGMQPIYDFVGSAGDRPFFLWYAPMLPHEPHNPPERLLAKYRVPGRDIRVARYYAMIDWFDETVGELLGHLDRQGLRENTVVVYVSDNGWIQPLGEQGQFDTRSKLSAYEAGARTPIMVRWPGRIRPGRDDRTLVSTLDIAPTVLRAVGLEPRAGMSGIDLRDAASLARRDMLFGALFAHTAVDLHDPAANLIDRTVVRKDGWKLLLPHAPNRQVPLTMEGTTPEWKRYEPELYNVLQDPQERNEQAARYPQLVRELRAAIDAWWPVPQ